MIIGIFMALINIPHETSLKWAYFECICMKKFEFRITLLKHPPKDQDTKQ